MAEKPKQTPKPKPKDRDEPVKIDLEPEVALRAIVKGGPHSDAKPTKRPGPGRP